MKRLASVALLLFLGGGLMAQQADTASAPQTEKTKHFAVGATFGSARNYHIIDMSYMQDMQYDEFCSGYSYGLQFAYMPANWFALRLDAVLVDKDYSMNHIFQYENSSARVITNTYTDNQYLDVPLVADFSLGKAVRIHAFGGGYCGYWLSSHRSGVSHAMNGGDANNFDEEVEFSEVRDNRVEYGFVYGGGLSCRLAGCVEVNAEAKWYYGVSDIQNDYQLYLNPRYNTTMVLQGGVRYLF